MKTFFGSIFIERTKLAKCGILHPIKLEYYKLISEDSKVAKEYGIEIIKINSLIKLTLLIHHHLKISF